MKPESQVPSSFNGFPGRSGLQGNPPPGATVLQPIVEERVREVVKERVENRYIEVPQVYYVEKVVEVPREVPEEKIVRVVKPVKKEVIKYVKKPVYVDKFVEVPEIKYVDKIIEVPRYAIKEKIVEVPKILVIERIIPVLKSYRKEQVVSVEPEAQIPFGGALAPELDATHRNQPRGQPNDRVPKTQALPPLWGPEALSTSSPVTHVPGLRRDPSDMPPRQGSFATEATAVRKSASGPPFAVGPPQLGTPSPHLLHENTASSIN
ncbi:hypothetical protein cyc_01545 [Cyclospora cayetanensis]|uniref:Alveolin domain containing intermediate filament IMC8 n=1 Tax=Cyclospora cayetanensis TaxID=88456 RepID=A0A1D3D5Z2_9EIME|nr:hypothetical protein cyc_01545 [Cyclospora cayetanensis]